jgi:peptidoglycan hydrolase-like protein with peptidoglycan-binding domain
LEKGSLTVNVYADSIATPIEGAQVRIIGESINTVLTTDLDGKTEQISIDAPDVQYSLTPQKEVKPFTEYTVEVIKEGFVNSVIEGVEVFPGVLSIQDVFLFTPDETEEAVVTSVITPPDIWDPTDVYFDDSAAEDIITFVLPFVIVPEYIIVHDGAPTATSVPRYYVPFVDYIKNVACSEIYSTWPVETIKANVHAIVSFTLNRVYTEWYRSRGFNFTITALPAFDQKYTRNRTIFESISNVVDDYFNRYIRIGSQNQPLLAHYNDGITSVNANKPGWLSQWGSKELGDRGFSALEIIRYYYGQQANLYDSEIHDNYPSSFPGYNLVLGSCGEPVQKIQNQLNIIRRNFPGIPIIPQADGIYDEDTRNTVRVFQEVFNVPVTGIVDFATWYRISNIYIAVARLLETTF